MTRRGNAFIFQKYLFEWDVQISTISSKKTTHQCYCTHKRIACYILVFLLIFESQVQGFTSYPWTCYWNVKWYFPLCILCVAIFFFIEVILHFSMFSNSKWFMGESYSQHSFVSHLEVQCLNIVGYVVG